MFGHHLPMRLVMERELCARSTRLVIQDSSYLTLENATNRLGKLEFGEFMNCEIMS